MFGFAHRPPLTFDLSAATPSRSQLSSTLQLHGGGAWGINWPLLPLVTARRITICLPRSKLSASENLHARIASGTDDPGHRRIKATVAAMRPSARRPLLDIPRKIFAQQEQALGRSSMSKWRCNACAAKLFLTFFSEECAPTQS